jgi:hypothetical protein
MDAFELAKKVGGTFNANKVRAVVDGQLKLIAMFDGAELVLTDDGRRALNQAESETVVVKEDAAPRKKKAKAGLEAIPEPAPAVELPDVQLSDE